MKKMMSILLAALLVIMSIPFNARQVLAANRITVDCSQIIREATHCANGSLYGIIENIPNDVDNLVAPLHPFVMRNPARGVPGNQHPFGDAIQVARRLSSIPGAKVSIDLADILPYWPYQWRGMNHWLGEVRSFINDKKASGCTNWYGYEIWNEADGTWKDTSISFEEMWKQTYQVIRQNDPGEKIIGPCDGWYYEPRMRSFLQYCKDNHCLPDIMSWHELSGINRVANDIKAYRALEKSLGIPELPISINEYCDAEHELEGQPGSSARFIGKFERYQIDSAMISWWYNGQPGRLGSLMATDTQKGAGWYFYQWYGDMTGNMVSVTPPDDNSGLVDGAACVDENQEYISFIFGGPNDGTINTVVRNIPSFIGTRANVKIEKIDWVSKDTVSYGPSTVSNQTYDVVNGQITVSMSGCNRSSGYRIYITKSDGSQPPQPTPTTLPEDEIISGATYKLINRNSGKALGVASDSTQNNANVHQWEDNGKTSQQWTAIDQGGNYKFMNVNAQKALDVSGSSTENGGNIILWPDNGQDNQRWFVKSIGNGYFELENINSGKLLDVERGSLENGGNVCQWVSNGGANQQWKLIRTDASVPTNPPTPTDSPTPTYAPTPTNPPVTTDPVTPTPTDPPITSDPVTPTDPPTITDLPTPLEKKLTLEVSGDGWDGGYNMNIILKNEGEQPITNWKIELNPEEVHIASIWCAKIDANNVGAIVPESYNQNLGSKASVNFGFNGNGTIPASISYTVLYLMNGTWSSYTDNATIQN